jgi:hypothetical protein
MVDLKSVFGEGARMCINDPVLAHKFICECYQEIQDNKVQMTQHFGSDLIREIETYVSLNPCEAISE